VHSNNKFCFRSISKLKLTSGTVEKGYKNMKSFTPKIWIIGLCFASLLVAASALASPSVTLTFDENGNESGVYSVPAGGTGSIHYLSSGTDGLSGTTFVGHTTEPAGSSSTLDYLIPILGNNTLFDYGWVVVYAPGTSTPGTNDQNIVDLIHFDNSNPEPPNYGPSYNEGNGTLTTTYGQMFYYSKEGSGNLANNWVSSPTLSTILGAANTAYVTESVTGNIDYDPANDLAPGFNWNFSTSSAAGTQYDFDFLSQIGGNSESQSVPDGGMTVELLGLSLAGFAGMGALRRKLSA
jgi:hypothetical protein